MSVSENSSHFHRKDKDMSACSCLHACPASSKSGFAFFPWLISVERSFSAHLGEGRVGGLLPGEDACHSPAFSWAVEGLMVLGLYAF